MTLDQPPAGRLPTKSLVRRGMRRRTLRAAAEAGIATPDRNSPLVDGVPRGRPPRNWHKTKQALTAAGATEVAIGDLIDAPYETEAFLMRIPGFDARAMLAVWAVVDRVCPPPATKPGRRSTLRDCLAARHNRPHNWVRTWNALWRRPWLLATPVEDLARDRNRVDALLTTLPSFGRGCLDTTWAIIDAAMTQER